MKAGELRLWTVDKVQLNEPFLIIEVHDDGETTILDRKVILKLDTRNIEKFSELVDGD